MAEHISQQKLTRIATVSDGPARTHFDRYFGLPPGIYAWTVGLYLAFVGLMALLFSNRELVIPLVVISGFVAFAFGVAAVWTKMSPDNNTSPMTWGQLSSRGIETLTCPLADNFLCTALLLRREKGLPGVSYRTGLSAVRLRRFPPLPRPRPAPLPIRALRSMAIWPRVWRHAHRHKAGRSRQAK